MVITEALRTASSSEAVARLLTAYLEAVVAYDAGYTVPDALTRLPVRGERDIAARYAEATTVLRRRLAESHPNLVLVAEAVDVFGTAWERMCALDRLWERAA